MTSFNNGARFASSNGLVVAMLCLAVQHGIASRSTASTTAVYDAFRMQHRKNGLSFFHGDIPDPVSYMERMALFETRKAEVDAHNARGDKSWTMAVNHFADYTPGEMQSMLGYKRVGGRWAEKSQGSSFVQTGAEELEVENIDVSALAKVVDWRKKMNFSNFVHNQGGCGSCWAHAAVAGMEAHYELTTGSQAKLATQEIIDCTPNPRHCGGTGGCQGATSEMAFEEARNRGISLLSKYAGVGGKCPMAASDAVRPVRFVRLPENKASYLLHSLANTGPVVMSVDANPIFMYGGGVFAGCKPDTVVNHAVLGVGYGHDKQKNKDYWLIKNSWGEGWGEKGYIRLERFNQDDQYCGIDNNPQEGVYCDNGPASIRVCNMCGATSDSTYPVFEAPPAKTSLRSKVSAKVHDTLQTQMGF